MVALLQQRQSSRYKSDLEYHRNVNRAFLKVWGALKNLDEAKRVNLVSEHLRPFFDEEISERESRFFEFLSLPESSRIAFLSRLKNKELSDYIKNLSESAPCHYTHRVLQIIYELRAAQELKGNSISIPAILAKVRLEAQTDLIIHSDDYDRTFRVFYHAATLLGEEHSLLAYWELENFKRFVVEKPKYFDSAAFLLEWLSIRRDELIQGLTWTERVQLAGGQFVASCSKIIGSVFF
jgi:hypothetical protein